MEILRVAGRFVHRELLNLAINSGDIELTDSEAKVLGYDERQRREALMNAHENAALIAQTVHHDPEGAHFHLQQRLKLARDPEGETLQETSTLEV